MSLLSARGLSLSLPDRAAQTVFGARPMVEIFKDVDLELEAGESLGIVGESGRARPRLAEHSCGCTDPARVDCHSRALISRAWPSTTCVHCVPGCR